MILRRLANVDRPVADLLARLPVRLELKLIAGFLVVVALVVLLGGAGLAILAETNRRTETLIATQERSDEYRDLADHGHALLIAISSALWMPRAQMVQLDSGIDDLRRSLAKLRPLAGTDPAEVEAVRREYDKFIDIANREMALLRAGDIDLAGAVQTEQGQPEALKLRELTDRLVDEAQAEAARQVAASRRSYHRAYGLLLGFVIAAAAVGLYLAHTISGSLVGPLRAVGSRLAEIAAGDFTRRVEIPNRDEIGALADNVNRTSEQLGRLYADLEAEKARSEEMLYGILPRRIIERMRGGEGLIADRVADATVLFSDLAGFTELSNNLAPEEVVDVLDVLFSRFDTLAERLGLEKIKTIGDGYMVAAGVQHPRPDHAAVIAEMALAMRSAADIATRALGVIGQPIRIRIGLHSGPLVAGVLGSNKLVYDVWGDTVNTASRMEKYGEPGRINVSAVTRDLLGGAFRFETRDPIEVKGKGEMQTFFLERHIGPRRFRNLVRRLTGTDA